MLFQRWWERVSRGSRSVEARDRAGEPKVQARDPAVVRTIEASDPARFLGDTPPYPARMPKGKLERRLGERAGRRVSGQVLGASDVGVDASSGGEYLEAQPNVWERS